MRRRRMSERLADLSNDTKLRLRQIYTELSRDAARRPGRSALRAADEHSRGPRRWRIGTAGAAGDRARRGANRALTRRQVERFDRQTRGSRRRADRVLRAPGGQRRRSAAGRRRAALRFWWRLASAWTIRTAGEVARRREPGSGGRSRQANARCGWRCSASRRCAAGATWPSIFSSRPTSRRRWVATQPEQPD